MYILGLTGGIASGKSTVSRYFSELGAAHVDADAIVHQLQGPDTPQTQEIASHLGARVLTPEGALNRSQLAALVAADPAVLEFLEGVLHPAVRREEARQIAAAAAAGAAVVVLDVPLLFETDGHLLCDGVALCDCPEDIRQERAFERPGMTAEKWRTLHARRWPMAQLRQAADFLIPTGGTLAETEAAVTDLYTQLAATGGQAWPARWPAVDTL